jgi:Uma2 family endonuclease
VNGILTEIPPESNLNARIAVFLFTQFLKLLPFTRLCHKDAELQVTSIKASFRIPDLMVLSEAGEAALAGSSCNTITLEMPAPVRVIEVVSPDDSARDYRFKRSEYAVRGVPEYWIVDPAQKQVLILTLVEGFYDEAIFKGEQPLVSPTFPDLTLTPDLVMLCGCK